MARIGFLTVAVPPLVSGMSTWMDRVIRSLATAHQVCLYAITHAPHEFPGGDLPYPSKVIYAPLAERAWAGETVAKAVRWLRLLPALEYRAPELVTLDLVVTDATPGVVNAGYRLRRTGQPRWLVLMGGDTFAETRGQRLAHIRHTLLAQRLARADAILVDGEDLRDTLVARGINCMRVRVVPHGIDTRRFAPDAPPEPLHAWLAEHALSLRSRLVVVHGRLAPENGTDDLPAILEHAVDTTVLVIGPGKVPETFRAGLAGRSVEVCATGCVALDVLVAALVSADVGLYPVRRAAGISRAVLEAMACGKPVVTTDTGAMRSVIHDGQNGRLVPAGNLAQLSQAVQDLLADPSARATLGQAARKTVEQRFNADRVDEQYRQVVENLLGDPTPG